jgi:hypothetical protein
LVAERLKAAQRAQTARLPGRLRMSFVANGPTMWRAMRRTLWAVRPRLIAGMASWHVGSLMLNACARCA